MDTRAYAAGGGEGAVEHGYLMTSVFLLCFLDEECVLSVLSGGV